MGCSEVEECLCVVVLDVSYVCFVEVYGVGGID